MVVNMWFRNEAHALINQEIATPDSLEATKDSWHMLSASWDGVSRTRKVYFDGALVFSIVTLARPTFTGNVLTIGDYMSHMNGSPDTIWTSFADVRAWTSALTDEQIAHFYERGVPLA